MCFNRARAWALRDAASDVLMGIGIVEEVRDIETEIRREHVTDTRREHVTDTSDLNDQPDEKVKADEQPSVPAEASEAVASMTAVARPARGRLRIMSLPVGREWVRRFCYVSTNIPRIPGPLGAIFRLIEARRNKI
jgi:hypothetical protein